MDMNTQEIRKVVEFFKQEQTDQGYFKNIDFLYDTIEELLKCIEEKEASDQ